MKSRGIVRLDAACVDISEGSLSTMTDSKKPMLLSIHDTANELGVSDRHVEELVRRGDLPSVKLGRRRMIPRVALERIVEAAAGRVA